MGGIDSIEQYQEQHQSLFDLERTTGVQMNMAAVVFQPTFLSPTIKNSNKSFAFSSLSQTSKLSTTLSCPSPLSVTTTTNFTLQSSKRRTGYCFRCFSALNPDLKNTLDKVVTSNKVILFMKGTKDFPQCGFSNTVVQILKSLDVPFETLDILENEILRSALKEYSNWPTFPQLYIDGEFYGGCDITVALNPDLKNTLDKVVTSNKVILFMKGTKDFPQCGFSNTVVQILKSLDVPFETLDILENEILRSALKEYSNWPTFPQLYIDGEFYGGCDITVEAYKNGELQETLEKAMCS